MFTKDPSHKILFLEDNLVLSETIKELLEYIGYSEIKILQSGENIIHEIDSFNPSIVLMDIKLKGKTDGIEIAEQIRNTYSLPIIFISSFNDPDTIHRVKNVNPEGFISKPFSKETLAINLELILHNYYHQKAKSTIIAEKQTDGNLFIRDRGWLKKINIEDINYIKTEGSYTRIFTKDKEFILRSTIREIMANLPTNKFIRIHKSYIVNFDNIDAVSPSEVMIGNSNIPISKTYYADLQARINKINS
ncbi:response regulator transcription factor [Belliella sp. DSM 111904]|uniref:Response regulator transcription factor n=1 Tax=Belliella filtrata TaxID=2923435 RepID=A0ABS9V5H9_9BACT|nr:response regulator transcription factor [Belliella filtrata]MCH7411628.1 response regulator transcription factor [Belliella filtrata]